MISLVQLKEPRNGLLILKSLLRLNISRLSFVIRVNLLHLELFSFLYGLFLSLCCFSILVNNCFQVSFNVKFILYVNGPNNKNAVTELLK